jgi:hypothetical protein
MIVGRDGVVCVSKNKLNHMYAVRHGKETPMKNKLLLLGFLLCCMPLALLSQTTKEIPVYPNAKFNTEREEGKDHACCSFTTTDPLNKVVAFYEAALKSKAMDIPAIAAKYPAMKQQLQQMQQQIPPGVQYRAIALGEAENGSLMPPLFEIIAAKGHTNFSLTDEQMGASKAQTVYEFHKAAGTMDNLDREYDQWFAEHPIAKPDECSLPIYPGAYIDDNSDKKGAACYRVMLLSTDSFEKVVAFYKDKLKGQFKDRNQGNTIPGSLSLIDEHFTLNHGGEDGDGPLTVVGKMGAVNRTVEITETDEMPTCPFFDANMHMRVRGALSKCVHVELSSETLDESCLEILKRPNVQWKK